MNDTTNAPHWGRNATNTMRTASQRLTRDQLGDLERQFKALSSPVRLHILLLLQEQHGSRCVDDLIESYAARYEAIYEQGPFSAHLRTLYYAGLIDFTREGKNHYYFLCPDTFQTIRAFLARFADTQQRLEVVV